jgi:hypothetical protein
MTASLIAGIEQILERKVIAFVSANHIDPDTIAATWTSGTLPAAVGEALRREGVALSASGPGGAGCATGSHRHVADS